MSRDLSFQFSAFLRALFLIFSAAVYTAILCLPAFITCLLDSSGRWPSVIQRTWVNWLLFTNGIRLKVQGLENLKKNSSYIFISNHASLLDIPVIISAIPLPVRFIAKKSLAWIPVLGWFLLFSQHILIERESPKSALKSLKKSTFLLDRGISIIVFPEGTRSLSGEVGGFKRGAFLLALKSQTPIAPISVSGTHRMLPRTGWCLRPETLLVHISKPIPTRDCSMRGYQPLMDKVRNTIIQNMESASPQT